TRRCATPGATGSPRHRSCSPGRSSPRVDKDHADASCLEDLVKGDPVDPGGFHRDGGDTANHEPVGETMEIRREDLERAHRGRVQVGGDGDVVLFGTAIDAGGIRVDTLEECGARCWVLRGKTPRVLHGMLLLAA